MKDNNLVKQQWYADYLLVQDVIDGNIQVWDNLYKNAYPIASRYVRRIYKDWHIEYDQMDDIVNEAFMKCFYKLESYMGNSKFSTWVCGFCRYILLNHYHKYILKNTSAIIQFYTGQLLFNNSNPESIIIKKERDLCIWTAFSSLNNHHQLLLQCYVLDEIKPSYVKRITKMNYKEQNKELQIAIATLKRRFLHLYNKTEQ